MDRAREVMEKIELHYDDHMGFEIYVDGDGASWTFVPVHIKAYTCRMGVRVDISVDLLKMPDDVLISLIEAAIDNCAQDTDFKAPPVALKWIGEELWKNTSRPVTPTNVPVFSKMTTEAKKAFLILRDSGLLDDLPEGMVVRAGYGYAQDMPRRIIYIPNEILQSVNSPYDLAEMIYKRCILDHVVKRAIMKGMNMSLQDLNEEMETYADGVLREEEGAEA